ncbi:MAG: hypothetical protein WC979_02055 [Candidatus Pacearchaeota archaeon]|jgi:hypothetical protein|nr:hypothetical protein [Clostridia bacterium]
MIIYKVTNIINNKIYIGKSKNNNPKYLGSGIVIQYALRKYGKHNFVKDIIDTALSFDELNEKEKYWIKFFDSTNHTVGYNRSYGGDGYSGITDETREKLRLKRLGTHLKESTKDKIRDKLKNVKKTDEHKQSLADAWDATKHVTDEILAKRAVSLQNINKKYYIIENVITNEQLCILGRDKLIEFLNIKKWVYYEMLKNDAIVNNWKIINDYKNKK